MTPSTQDFEVVTDDDRRLARANRALFNRLQLHLLGKVMNKSLYDGMLTLINDHRFECRMLGIPYPDVVAVWLDKVRAVKVVRADIERADLQVAMVNWTREHPDVTVEEIARALNRHFPGYVKHLDAEVAN